MENDVVFILIPVVFFVASLVIALAAAKYTRRRTLEKVNDLARYLGLQIRKTEVSPFPGVKLPEWASFLLTDQWSVHGTYAGGPVEIHMESRGSGKSRTVYTCIGASFASNLGAGLKATREGFWSKVGKVLLNSQDISLGVEEFDSQVILKGQEEGKIRQLFSDSGLRSRFLDFLERQPQGWMDDRGVHVDIPGTFLNPEKMRDLLQIMGPLVAGR